MKTGIRKGSIVNTEKGFEKIENCGTFVGNVLVYRIKLKNGIALWATGRTKLLILNDDGDLIWKDIDSLLPKDKVILKINDYTFGKETEFKIRKDTVPKNVMLGTKECIEHYIEDIFGKGVICYSQNPEFIQKIQVLLTAIGKTSLAGPSYIVQRPSGAITEYNPDLKDKYDFSYVDSVVPENIEEVYKYGDEFVANNIMIKIEG